MYTEPLSYILATQNCLALLWIFYRIVLARRKTLALNRYFLLTSVALSFLIPALSIPVAEPYGIMFEAAGQTIETVTPQEEVSSPTSFDWGKALLLIQLIGSTAVLSFLVAGILRLRRLTYHATLIQNGKIRIYSLQAPDLAFSLFNRIYLSTADRDETTLRQIVAHETAHIHFHHSRDIALICALQTLFWWNPFVWLWRRSLREVHEFQADDFVLNNGSDARFIGGSNQTRGIDSALKLSWERPDEHTLIYHIFFPAATLPYISFREGTSFGFSLLVNDDDGKGRKDGLTLAPKGTEPFRNPHLYKDLVLIR